MKRSCMKPLIKPLFATTALIFSMQSYAVLCKDIPQKDEMHAQTVCIYSAANIEDAYQQALKSNETEATQLASHLPQKRFEEKRSEAYVTYTPISPSKYKINLHYDGGETEWMLLKLKNTVKIIFDYYPD
jgi:hypothetical protein